jgi:hypothetical protein
MLRRSKRVFSSAVGKTFQIEAFNEVGCAELKVLPGIKACRRSGDARNCRSQKSNDEWYAWAKKYLIWYDQIHCARPTAQLEPR